MRTDGRTDMTKLIVTLRNFVNTPKNVWSYEFVQHKPLHVKVVTFRTHNYTIRHDLSSLLRQSICVYVTYTSSNFLILLVFALLITCIWFNLIIFQVEIH